jgi:hypothetical protein
VDVTPPTEGRVLMTLEQADDIDEYASHIYLSMPVEVRKLLAKPTIDIPEELAIALKKAIGDYVIPINQK